MTVSPTLSLAGARFDERVVRVVLAALDLVVVDVLQEVGVKCPGISHGRDCHFADALSPSLLKRMLKGEGGAAE